MKNLNIALDHQILDGELQTEFVNLDLDKIEFVTIESVHTTNLDTEVYDLEIEQIPNYTTNIGIVHNGGGRRKGSIAVYLEPWHADVFDFLDLRKNHGKEEMRARDLFLAMWTPNLLLMTHLKIKNSLNSIPNMKEMVRLSKQSKHENFGKRFWIHRSKQVLLICYTRMRLTINPIKKI